MLDIGTSDVSDNVCCRLVRCGLVVPLINGLREHASFGESLDELPHVGSIRDGVISNFGKVAALTCVDEDGVDGHRWVPWGIKSGQVGFEVFQCDLAVHFLEVIKDGASRDCRKTM